MARGRFPLTCLALLLALPALRAEEGMWTFDNLPVKQIQAKYGFTPAQAWLDHVRLSALRFPGGSGSFVSADGLVLTNHHVGHDWIQKVSSKEKDFVKNGFVARTRAEEVKVPGLVLYTLMEMEDVTAQVDRAVKPEMNEQQADAARKAALAELVKEQTERTKLACEPVSLYQGGQLWIYRYKKHEDVRLVMAPEYDVAAFGKEWDNFSWTRHDLDFSLFRVYENGKPYQPAHHLTWSAKGAGYGDLTFVVGHPGRTSRLETLAMMEAKREVFNPLRIQALDRTRKALQAYAAQGEDQERQVSAQIMGTENGYKVMVGETEGLKDREAMAKVAAAEQELRAKVQADPQLKALAGESWVKIEQALAEQKAIAKEVSAMGQLAQAAALVKRSGGNLQPAQKLQLMTGLKGLVSYLGASHDLVKAVLGDKAPEAALEALKDGLPEGAQTLMKQYGQKQQAAQAVISEHLARIAKARFKVYGTATYPDATFTLRLSYGQIATYPANGTLMQPFTTFAGLYDRAAAWGPKAENGSWSLPKRWMDRRDKLNLFTPYNFISTNDITGGNSGSPVVNAKGDLVGLAFDGNIESLPGRYYFDGRVNRTLCVDVRGITEALAKVYDAQHLVRELAAK